MSKAQYNKDGVAVNSGKDGIIIRKHIAGLEGGRLLDTTGYSLEVIPCGIPVAVKTANGVTTHKPIVPASNAFTLPEGFTFEGVASATAKAGLPTPVMFAGVVNKTAMLNYLKELFPDGITDVSTVNLSAIETACKHLMFVSDEANDVPSNS